MLKYKHNTFKRKIKIYTKAFYKNKWYRILWTKGRYLFSSTRWLRPIVHIDLYKDEVKKIWNP